MPGSESLTLDIVLLRSLLEVVDAGGFALAAQNLALTPSAVSGHIKRLERSAGKQLLVRTTRSLELTAAGELLYMYARNIVDLEREARARLGGASLQGRLVLGASEDFAGAWLPQVLHTFQRWHPQASIELKVGITADLLRRQAHEQIDVIFGKQCSRTEGEGELLWSEPLVWAYAAGRLPDAAQALPLALFPAPCVYREAALAALAQAEHRWRLAFDSASMAGCLAAAQSGFAVTPVARSQMRDGLRILGAAEGLPALPDARFYAFPRNKTPAVLALVEAVRGAGQRHQFHAA
ncbi:LysR substrate-binding domain-containing protein [Janthinobacterium sp. 1_2014MBL_MicDiv]|uniref:LysR substrate-binding domain-containing protein n=1 Tax=Janthinobacterium sp. 1_2014MBL_MicDiv TaxID=1644131 RepID=UPI0008F55065|nr:LysR substrate-binding domain-containing protein [Janthinobacterium sp. 1_2014MBL_MicDiv]APA67845.1 LysR family transcriptional regulator [Janthinobacterium sp. 1_2014MBL_MicDiv]